MKNNTAKQVLKSQPENEALLWNMSDEKQVQDFVEQLQARTSNDQIITAGLVLLLAEIANQTNIADVADKCSNAIEYLFRWTVDFEQANRDYVRDLKTRKVSEFT